MTLRQFPAGIAFAVIVTTGCVSTGHRLETSRVEDIKPGITSVADLGQMFGTPWSQTKLKDGTTRYVWQYTRAGFAIGVVEQQVLTVIANPNNMVKEFYVRNQGQQ